LRLGVRLRWTEQTPNTCGQHQGAERHQVVVDRHEVLADNGEAALGQQEVNVGHAAMLRILDRDDRPAGAAILHRFQRVFEAEAGQRQAIGGIFGRSAVAVAARRPLERNGAGRIGRASGGVSRGGARKVSPQSSLSTCTSSPRSSA